MNDTVEPENAQRDANAKPGLLERLVQLFAAALDDALIWFYRRIRTGYRNCGPIQGWARAHRGKDPEPERAPTSGAVRRRKGHMHASGDTVGLHPDVCAKCGHDIRHPLHWPSPSERAKEKLNNQTHEANMNSTQMKKNLSTCCNAPVRVVGSGATHWYECAACGAPCLPVSPGDDPPRMENRRGGWRSALRRWLLRLACPHVSELDALGQKLYALSSIVQNLRRRMNDIEGDIEGLDDAIASLKMDVHEARSIALDVEERVAAFEAASKNQRSTALEQ